MKIHQNSKRHHENDFVPFANSPHFSRFKYSQNPAWWIISIFQQEKNLKYVEKTLCRSTKSVYIKLIEHIKCANPCWNWGKKFLVKKSGEIFGRGTLWVEWTQSWYESLSMFCIFLNTLHVSSTEKCYFFMHILRGKESNVNYRHQQRKN